MDDTTEPNYTRVIEDVQSIIRHAKLDEKTLLPRTQALYYADDTDYYRLLELDSELLSKLNEGAELTFRGSKDDKAVLCTDNKTYEVKEAETSNSLLLIPRLKFPDEVKSVDNLDMEIDHTNILGVFHTYLEVKPCKPKVKKLRPLLEESAYGGSELESDLIESGVNFYSTDELLNIVQASEAELKAALRGISAFELKSKWRVLEFNYHFRVLSYLLALIDEQSWKIDEIPVADVLELLEDLVPVEILMHLITIYTVEVSTSSSDKHRVRLKEDDVCRFLGQSLLKSTSRLGLNEFLSAWKECVPLGFKVDVSQLDGLVYISTQLNQKIIHYCPEHELLEDVAERIQFLFTLKDKWSLEEIKPYIETFTTDKMDANAILTRYARASKLNGVRVFSSRHGK